MTNRLNTFLCSVAVSALSFGVAHAQSTTNGLNGQIVVDQKDPVVDVTVPDPEINVNQRAPEVTVEQPQPEITIQQAKPTVNVQQRAPIITVEQAQPVVTVRIPEPIITVRVPQPDIDVNTAEPNISVTQPEPVIRFIRPEPRIIVEESEPEIRVTNAEPEINMGESKEAKVTVENSEPKVNIMQSGEADVKVSGTDAKVNVTAAAAPKVNIEQGEARVKFADYKADAKGKMATNEDREVYAVALKESPFYRMRNVDVMGRDVYTEAGNDVGEIDNFGLRGDTVVALIGIGGLLGLGENNIAVPVDRLVMDGNRIVIPKMTQDQLEDMPEYDADEVRILETDERISDLM